MPLPDPTSLGAPVELPVSIVVGDLAAGAEPDRIGTVHVALRVDGLDDPDTPEGAYRLVAVDPGDVRHQLAALLDRYLIGLRADNPA